MWFIELNLDVFGIEELIEDYIIDLGLEFGLRTTLAVLFIEELRTKEMGDDIFVKRGA